MEEKKSLQVVDTKKKIFERVLLFLKKLFTKKQDTNEIAKISTRNQQDNNKKNFMESLKFDIYLLELQKKLKLREIQIKDLKEEEKNEIISLFEKQIEEKRNLLHNLNKNIAFYTKR